MFKAVYFMVLWQPYLILSHVRVNYIKRRLIKAKEKSPVKDVGFPHTHILKNSLTSGLRLWLRKSFAKSAVAAGLFLSVNDRSSLADHTAPSWKVKSGLKFLIWTMHWWHLFTHIRQITLVICLNWHLGRLVGIYPLAPIQACLQQVNFNWGR